jgi:drug/metabolite transporter (DMT)-like permease
MTSSAAGSTSARQTAGKMADIRSYLALAGGIVCIGFAAIFVKMANTTGDVVGFYRLGIASLALTIPVLLNWRRGRARLPREAVGLGVLAGLAFAADIGAWNTALTMISAATATLLGNTAPVWVGLGVWLIFREKPHATYWLGLALALGGAAMIIGLDALLGMQNGLGNLLGVLTGISYGAYQLVTRRAREHIDNLTYTWLFSATGALVFLVISPALGHSLVGLPVNSYLALLGLGLFSHLGGWLLINYAFGQLSASLVSVTLLGQPIFTALVAIPLLGETPTVWHVVGGLITLAGIFIVHRGAAQGSRVEREGKAE